MQNNETKKLDVRVQKTYNKLYKTFFKLLAVKPYENITVLEICGETGVHRATFYKHFVDKQDFVNFCFSKKMEELDLAGEETIFDSGAKTYYIDMCKKIISFVCENKNYIIDLNMMSSYSAFSEALERAASDYIEKRLTYAVSKGYILTSPIPLLSHYYAGAIVSLLKAWANNWDRYSKDDILKFILMRYNELDFSYRHNKYPSAI